MNTLKVLGNCCLVFVAIISVGISLVYGYYHFIVREITVGVNYIDNQIGLDIPAEQTMPHTIFNFIQTNVVCTWRSPIVLNSASSVFIKY